MSNEKFTPGEWVEKLERMRVDAALIEAAPKMYSLLKLARHEFDAVAEWCDEHDLPDDARGYRNLANGILNVLMEIRGKE